MRVLHFVTGGFSGGATQVAIALVKSAMAGDDIEPLLVLRRKRRADPRRIQALIEQGVPLETVNNYTHISSILALVQVCRQFKPDVLVAHGFSEHLWGRYAGLLARVPVLIHVEHNTRERYTWWRLQQAKWLTRYTRYLIGCSEGVRQRLLELKFPPEKCIAIPNGIDLAPFAAADRHPHRLREAGVVMVSRIGKQKDHSTLLHALHLLKRRGIAPPLYLAGQGKLLGKMQTLARQLGIDDQVHFLGHCNNVPELLFSQKIAVLSTHYEGMPLSLLEAMAAGCAVVASDVPGVKEVIDDGRNGLLAEHGSPAALADALQQLLSDEDFAANLAQHARRTALEKHSKELMNQRYHELFTGL